MLERVTILFGLLAAFVFFSTRLFCGLRDGKIWVADVWPADIERRSSPWNYRVALLLQAVFAVMCIVGFVAELWGL